jgi:hypothetical protein
MGELTAIFNTILLKEGQHTCDFIAAFNKWVNTNEWEIKNPIPIEMPEGFSQRAALCSSIFHPQYPAVPRRYVLHRLWEADKPHAAALLMNPSAASELAGDETADFMTSYVKERLGYGSLTIVNVSPVIKKSNTTRDDFPSDALNL